MTTIFNYLLRGDETSFQSVEQNSTDAIAIVSTTEGTKRSAIIRPSQSCTLAAKLTAAGTFTLYTTANFTTVLTSTTTTGAYVDLSELTANAAYGITIESDDAPTEGEIVAYIQGKTTLSISNWFPNGFVNLLQLGPTVSRTTQTDGSFVYTFTSYPVTANSPIALIQTGSSIQNGTITITSTVPAFNNQSEAFTTPAGYIGYLIPSLTGNVSGTVTVTVATSGTTQFAKSLYITG